MQKSLIPILFILVSMQLASASSLGDVLNAVDSSTAVLGIIFILIVVLVNYSLSKFFKDNKMISGVISISIALFAIWGINSSGTDYANIFNSFFFFLPDGFLETAWPLGLLAVWIFLIFKSGFVGGTAFLLMGGGALMILLGFTRVNETGFTITLGIASVVIGFILVMFRKKKKTVIEVRN